MFGENCIKLNLTLKIKIKIINLIKILFRIMIKIEKRVSNK
jgi:hypothetical protein